MLATVLVLNNSRVTLFCLNRQSFWSLFPLNRTGLRSRATCEGCNWCRAKEKGNLYNDFIMNRQIAFVTSKSKNRQLFDVFQKDSRLHFSPPDPSSPRMSHKLNRELFRRFGSFCHRLCSNKWSEAYLLPPSLPPCVLPGWLSIQMPFFVKTGCNDHELFAPSLCSESSVCAMSLKITAH